MSEYDGSSSCWHQQNISQTISSWISHNPYLRFYIVFCVGTTYAHERFGSVTGFHSSKRRPTIGQQPLDLLADWLGHQDRWGKVSVWFCGAACHPE
jgi:hypothetical protein